MRIEVPHLPIDDETRNGKFINATKMKHFRGQDLPAHFIITVDEKDELLECQIIGKTRFGDFLYWEQGQVIVKN